MEIQTEQDMIDFCDRVNKKKESFYIDIIRRTPPDEIKSRLAEILLAESPEKVNNYSNGNKLKELFIQGISSINYHSLTKELSIVTIDEIPVIYPSGRASYLEGPMTGVLVNSFCSEGYVFQMRGKNVSEPFGFQATAAGFVNFGENPRETFKDELKTETAKTEVFAIEPLSDKPLAVLPFMKGKYPQLLFLYGGRMYFSAPQNLPVLTSIKGIDKFEKKIKEDIFKGKKIQESYPFILPSNRVNNLVEEIYQRDHSQSGKNGGFFGPIRESHYILKDLLKNK